MSTTADPFDTESDRIILSAAERLRERIAAMEQSRDEQPDRLTTARAEAEQARAQTLTAEPWADCWKALPLQDAHTGELAGMMALPTIDGKELWGARLAFDVLDAGTDRDQIDTVLSRYFGALDRNFEHLFFVFAAALRTIAEHIVPHMLDSLEQHASDYNSRAVVAEGAVNAWRTRLSDDLDDTGKETTA